MREASRITVFCWSLLLVTSCDKTNAPAGPPAPSASPTDARKASYERQEKCARDARDWYRHAWEDSPGVPGLVSTYTNHYSAKLSGCFIVVDSTLLFRTKNGQESSKRSATLTDVLENRDIGTADWYVNAPFNQCQVNGAKCSSPDEWQRLLKPYMEE
jgi:hypothetical protein